MSDKIKLQASCLCGGVSIGVNGADTSVGACHCRMCRKWGGGPLLAIDCGSQVEFDGEDKISVFASSDWAERGFCSSCGSHLFYRLKHNSQYIMPVGLFDGEAAFEFDHQIFIDKKPGYYCFANDTKNMTGDEVMSAFAAGCE